MATNQPKRLYQVWKGSNRFLCGGRLIFGPEVLSLFLSTFLIAAPAAVFCSVLISKIMAQDKFPWIPVLAVAAIITISDLIFLFVTSGRDPGIVPRNTRPFESEEMFDLATTPSMEWIQGRTPHLRVPRTKEVVVNGIVVKVKYCDTCSLYRPPRASHCSVCNNCVKRFDHHCPWVGQCIGLRNYRFFFLFLSSSTFLCIYVFTFSLLNILMHKKDSKSWKDTMSEEVLSLILVIYCFVAFWFVGGLTVFHLYLICTNQTTYENFRNRYDKKENPHNRGILMNFKEVFFSTIPPSMNDFRSWVFEEHIDVGAFTPNRGSDFINSKDKIDMEMGSSSLTNVTSSPIPQILQKLDHNGINDNLNRDGNEDRELVPSFFPSDQELRESSQACATIPSDHELRDRDQGCSTTLVNHDPQEYLQEHTEANEAEVAREGSTLNETAPVNHDNHIRQA
ncbi:zinc finger protein [Cinnamomum micranthum f. kanehirae]|uniref:S-acyltransferase n=1 Tax=Cinnamomum micranthum f. kanehirae TaxID=337451 RepID=A0A3S5WGI8_9MAGN|nr:zinc finger protein [Cinnamomum micranthum f. kanehirae]